MLIGSGITPGNAHMFKKAHGFIVGSYLKRDGHWNNEMDEERLQKIMEVIKRYFLVHNTLNYFEVDKGRQVRL